VVLGFQRNDPRAWRQAVDILGRHQEKPLAVEADHFGLDRRTAEGQIRQELPSGSLSPGSFHDQAVDACQVAAGQQAAMAWLVASPATLEKVAPALQMLVVQGVPSCGHHAPHGLSFSHSG
jgi:hypothetical protein